MRYFTPCCFSLSLFLVACADESSTPPVPGETQVTGEDVKQKIGEAADTAKEFTKQKRDEYAKQLDQQLEGLDEKIAELETKGAKLKDDAKVEWNKKLEDLKSKRGKLSEKLKEFNASSSEAWEGLKKDLDIAWGNLKEAYDKTAEEVKE
ncbi:MAG: hypothetical protein CME31_00540 [Gimesia sp.]|mgnify:FL=1|uniref:Coiled coil domain-containing protein n=1 Tax=Gimesia maris TaxID=122 RepID=A0A3D3RCI1_9PLAN|nr:hypothetical protein [Gimesia sp.]HCO26326.1 hypothetical protein [Gimesia maris]|tara:strand:+ start:328 stop:777 length:450 start_codon:yes stop_codon:yes gene_type:complete